MSDLATARTALEKAKVLLDAAARLDDSDLMANYAFDTLGPLALCECIWDLTQEHIAIENPPPLQNAPRSRQSQALYSPNDNSDQDDVDGDEDESESEVDELEEDRCGTSSSSTHYHGRVSNYHRAHSSAAGATHPDVEFVPETPPRSLSRRKDIVNAEPHGEVIEQRTPLNRKGTRRHTVNAEPRGEVIDEQHYSNSTTSSNNNINESSSREANHSASRRKQVYKKGRRSWNLILEDAEKGAESRALFYLAHLPNELIRALIIGDLPSQMQNAIFRAKISPWVQARNAQGTYVIYIALTGISPTDKTVPMPVMPVRGMGPSPRHMMKLLDTISLYINVKDRNSVEVSKAIDGQFGRNITRIDYSAQRLYGGGGLCNVFNKHKLWIESWETAMRPYRQRTLDGHDLELDEWLPRCLPYCGLASDVGERYSQHAGKASSRLFALIRASLEYLYPTMYDVSGFFFQVLPTVATEDVGLDECITSMVVSGSPWDGGLMFDHPGLDLGRKSAKTGQIYLQGLQSNYDFLRANGNHEENITQSLAQYKQFSDRIQQIQSDAVELARCQEQFEALEQRLAAASSLELSLADDSFLKESNELIGAFEEYAAVSEETEKLAQNNRSALEIDSPVEPDDTAEMLEALEAFEKDQADESTKW